MALSAYRIATVYAEILEVAEALKHYQTSSLLYFSSGNKVGEADCLNGIGMVYFRWNIEDKKTLEYLAQSEEMYAATGSNRQYVAQCQIGSVYA